MLIGGNSTFDSNSAVAGAVVYVTGLNSTEARARNGTSVVAPCAQCVVLNSSATAWGEGLYSTDLFEAGLSIHPRAVSSGQTFRASVEVFDGAPSGCVLAPLS